MFISAARRCRSHTHAWNPYLPVLTHTQYAYAYVRYSLLRYCAIVFTGVAWHCTAHIQSCAAALCSVKHAVLSASVAKLHQGALQSKCSASEDVHCCCVQTRCLPLRQPALLYNWKTCTSTLFKTSYTCLWFRLVWLMCTSPPALNWHIAHDCALLNHVPQPLLHFPSLHYPLLHYLFPCITHYCITCYCTLLMTALPVTVHCP